ncbi:hypothetical protein [Rhodococcus sp. WMMA185]|uniref:hypothetical protein n=1 Tax=Rhodococcus sp. WMMA185 TaxID=679318 RepID=UPI001E5B1272|nr:hypothetical protein [Rhodococcus sp. WMMA185]
MVDESIDTLILQGLRRLGIQGEGMIRAFATAKTEPVSSTIARALHSGAERTFGSTQTIVPDTFGGSEASRTLTTDDIRDTIKRMCATRPMILIIDEFGKNLEAFAESGHLGDPYLLQELAELTQGDDALPLVIITMQHLSFDEYVQETSAARRREWSKVQGRFQDIPYVETPSQSRRLIVGSLERTTPKLGIAAEKWMKANSTTLEHLGLRDLVEDARDAIPLHPLTLAVLPDLCTRYGQNERTLFSFMGGTEPLAVPAFLDSSEWNPKQPPPLLGLDRVYDYFLDSAGSMIGVSENASRWMEIETRIRDTVGLTSAELRALKSIGVLNLISSGGSVRASRPMLEFALLTGQDGSSTLDEVGNVLTSLEDRGLIVYRTFSDEYRVWQGSDYDLRRAIAGAKRQCATKDLATLLNEVTPLEPAVAGRHSQRNGVLRIFEQKFSSLTPADFQVPGPSWDGVVLYATADTPQESSELDTPEKPIVVITPADFSAVEEAALEAAALQLALHSAEDENADWVAKRELRERTAAAQQQLRGEIGRTWNLDASWAFFGSDIALAPETGLSAVLSTVSDEAYSATPRVANEMIARRELTSQGAKARRVLMEAMLTKRDQEAFGIEGYGPERAIYEAVFRSTGIHRVGSEGSWDIQAPSDDPEHPQWKSVWQIIGSAFEEARTTRTNLYEVAKRLTEPPVGLKEGIVPLLIVANLLVRADEIALYEHGSLVLSIDDAVAERLTRNPVHFTVRNTGVDSGSRRIVVDALSARLIERGSRQPTFLDVATALFRKLRRLPPYVQKTKSAVSEEALEVRNAFHTASEPDVLIFETLPQVFGINPFPSTGNGERDAAAKYADRLAEAIKELDEAYDALLEHIESRLKDATAVTGTRTEIRQLLAGQAANLDDRVLEPRLRAFVGALARDLDDQAWLENVAMVVSDGHAPRVWTDDVANRFPLRISELGSTMRRVQAVLYERLAAGAEPDGFTISRMVLTHPDGTERTEFLSITERQRESIDPHVEPFLEKLGKLLGSRADACRMLMARLAFEETDTSSASLGNDRKDVHHG